MKRIFLLLMLLLPVSFPAGGQPLIARIDIVIPANNAALADLAGGVEHALQQQFALPISVRAADTITGDKRDTLVIAVSDSLIPWLQQHQHRYAAALAFYVSSTTYPNQLRDDDKVTALFRDQPLSRQLQLAKLLLPNLQRVGIVHGHQPLPFTVEELERSSKLDIAAINIEGQSDWPKILSQLMLDNDLLLGIDDPAIYNRDTIRSILLTTYRRGKFLIGPGRSFVSAGSLASCYTGPDQYLQQLLVMVGNLTRNQKLPRAQYPRAFRVAVNQQVAVSLGLSIQDEATLTARLQNLTGQSSAAECGDGC